MSEAGLFRDLPVGQATLLELRSQGFENWEIAERSGLALKSVESQTTRLFRRLGLKGAMMSKAVGMACRAEHFTEFLTMDEPLEPVGPPELVTVHFVAEGYSVATDAQKRRMSPSTLEKQRTRAREKVGALTLPHLVRCFYQLELLPLDPAMLQDYASGRPAKY